MCNLRGGTKNENYNKGFFKLDNTQKKQFLKYIFNK